MEVRVSQSCNATHRHLLGAAFHPNNGYP